MVSAQVRSLWKRALNSGDSELSAEDETCWSDRLDEHLDSVVLRPWFPRCLDRDRGGFRQSFMRDWTPGTWEPKALVFQSRMTWVAATVARSRQVLDTPFLGYASHGFSFLRETFWDDMDGGFFWGEDLRDEKHVYGIAFGILAAAAVHRSSQDPEALNLAKEAFAWLEEHARDHPGIGYREALNRDGTPRTPQRGSSGVDLIGTPLGLRSSNTHIHLLEAFAELYRVWPDPLLKTRIQELLDLFRKVLLSKGPSVPKTFTSDGNHVDGTSSYGHDLEVAYWLVAATTATGVPTGPDPGAEARFLVDHALSYGFDRTHGGFFLEGPDGRPAQRREKVWWVQAEGLCTLSLLHKLFGDDSPLYLHRFMDTWSFISRHLVDKRFGGWFGRVSENGRRRLDKRKGHQWMSAYHSTRALDTAAAIFRGMEPEELFGEVPRD